MGGSRRTSPSGGTAGCTGGGGGRVRMALPPSSIAAKEVSESAGTGRDPYQQPQDRLTRLAAAAAESLLFGTKLASDDDEDASGSEGRLPHLKPVSDPWRQRSLAGPPLAALRSSSGLGGALASRSSSTPLDASAASGDAAARRFLPDAAGRQVSGLAGTLQGPSIPCAASGQIATASEHVSTPSIYTSDPPPEVTTCPPSLDCFNLHRVAAS